MLLSQAGHTSEMLMLVKPLLLSLDPLVEPLQTNRHNCYYLSDTGNLMSNMIFEQLICFTDSQKMSDQSDCLVPHSHRTKRLHFELFWE